MKLNRFGVLFLLLAIISTPALCQQNRTGIYQLIEKIPGTAVCRGFVVQLHELTFVGSLSVNQIKVVEAKHNRELIDLLEIVVDHLHKMLTLKFKPGKGGFGSGNSIDVTIDGSAFTGSPQQKFKWSIPTDPM